MGWLLTAVAGDSLLHCRMQEAVALMVQTLQLSVWYKDFVMPFQTCLSYVISVSVRTPIMDTVVRESF